MKTNRASSDEHFAAAWTSLLWFIGIGIQLLTGISIYLVLGIFFFWFCLNLYYFFKKL